MSGLGENNFATAIGVDVANLRRCLEEGARPGLRTVFNVGRALACSPVEILAEGSNCIRNGSLFDRVLLNSSLRIIKTGPNRKHPPHLVESIGVGLKLALAGKVPLVSLPTFSARYGVTTGMVRHVFPDNVRTYTLRRCRERLKNAHDLREKAKEACVQYVTERSRITSMKLAVRDLMRLTGLSKHLLADELRHVLTSLSTSVQRG